MANVLMSLSCLLFVPASCFAQFKHPATSSEAYSLRKFLQDYAGHSDQEKTTRYKSAFVSLADEGSREVIVYLSGDGWCGSGGCTTLILATEGPSYRVVTKITITRPPVRVLTGKANGWHNISVQVRGGGVHPGYVAELMFDGNSYPNNPSAPPARELSGKNIGEVVVPYDGEGTPLYH